MKIEIVKVDSGRFCFHHLCKQESKYITPKGRIKKGTPAAQITHKIKSGKGGKRIKEIHFFYCRSCIDQLLLDCRASLDSRLWVFK
jgi:hypothetical protein